MDETATTSAQEAQPTAPISTWTPGPPPEKTPVPTAEPKKPAKGATILLHVWFPATWPWDEVDWQELWTEVHWQDEKGGWHKVEGRQGGLDGATSGTDGKVTGNMGWWVAESELGRGPFVWLVYSDKGGSLLAKSEPFYLPGSKGSTEHVDVSLGSPWR